MIDQLISELVAYGLQNGLIEDADKVYVTNSGWRVCVCHGKSTL